MDLPCGGGGGMTFVSKPPEERKSHSLVIPIAPPVMEALIETAAKRAMTKTELARKFIMKGLGL